jgi:nitrite reductase/ring-hydroxylating ferredoxin subunit
MRLDGTMRTMTPPAEWRIRAAELPAGRAVAFCLGCGSHAVRGLIVNHEGIYRAYVNRCPHVGTPLDLWPDEFLSEDGRWLVCSTHGALFEPDTGRCAAGPCAGDRLAPLPLRVDGETIVVACPPGPARNPA